MDGAVDYKALGARIRAARRARGMTQERLGELCGISTAHMGHIERGTRIPSLDTFYKIASSLAVTADELLLDSPKNPDSALLAVSKTLEGKDRAKVKAFVAAVKALADKIDEL
ncbi:MAG: helix-turn-helix transcriptional regulator [Clostridia bacterium]|nr:helix-turn-helix transcriptional regulator [Clostridia bacterium]